LKEPLTGFEGDEGADLEREAITALFELLHQLAHTDVSAHQFPSVLLRRTHTYPLLEQVFLDLGHSVVTVVKDRSCKRRIRPSRRKTFAYVLERSHSPGSYNWNRDCVHNCAS
jgi:hypothetical protein